MRIDFVIIGAQKCGTTSLAQQLAAHPDICFCSTKEPGYFNAIEDWEAGLEEYHSLYQPKDGQVCGEASTMYTFIPEWLDTHERLFAYNPGLKLIYIVRQPVERVLSNYTHRLLRRTAGGPPEEAVFADPAYVNRTRYGVQIRPYLELFGRESIMLLVFEEYIAEPLSTLKQIARFLGIRPEGFATGSEGIEAHRSLGKWYLPPSLSMIERSGPGRKLLRYVPSPVRTLVRRRVGTRLEEKPEFSPSLRRTLWRLLEDDVRIVEELLGRGLPVWRAGDSE